MKEVSLHTDGACSGNPGPGGYGVVLQSAKARKELCGGYRKTTNNRMELLAVIKGLEALQGRCRVTLYSDSKYVIDGLAQGWARRWRANGWRRNKREAALNPDLWGRLLDLCDGHEMVYNWVKGHAGDTENERCDKLSTTALAQPDLAVDESYERAVPGPASSLFDRLKPA